MPDQPRPRRLTPEAIAAELDAAERIFLFCLASDTRTAKAPDDKAPVHIRLITKGLIKREGSRIVINDEGREVLATLLAKHDKDG